MLNNKNPFVQNDEMMTLAGPRTPTEDYDSTGEWLLFDFNNISVNYNSDIKNSLALVGSDSDMVIDGFKRKTYDFKSLDKYEHFAADGFGAIYSYGNYIFPVHNVYGYPRKEWTFGLSHITNDKGDIIHKTWLYDSHNSTSIGDMATIAKAKFRVAQGLVTIEPADDGMLYLYSVSGKLEKKQAGSAYSTCSISITGLNPGIYVAVWRGISGTTSQKVVVR